MEFVEFKRRKFSAGFYSLVLFQHSLHALLPFESASSSALRSGSISSYGSVLSDVGGVENPDIVIGGDVVGSTIPGLVRPGGVGGKIIGGGGVIDGVVIITCIVLVMTSTGCSDTCGGTVVPRFAGLG